GMPSNGLAQLLAPFQVPDADGSIMASGDNHGSSLPLPYRQSIHRIGVPGKGLAYLMAQRLQVPNTDALVGASGDNHGSSLPLRYRQRFHRIGMPGKELAHLVGLLLVVGAQSEVQV